MPLTLFLSFNKLRCKDAVWQTLAIVNSIHAHTIDAHSIQFYMALVFLLSPNKYPELTCFSSHFKQERERSKMRQCILSWPANEMRKFIYHMLSIFIQIGFCVCVCVRHPPHEKRQTSHLKITINRTVIIY